MRFGLGRASMAGTQRVPTASHGDGAGQDMVEDGALWGRAGGRGPEILFSGSEALEQTPRVEGTEPDDEGGYVGRLAMAHP